jgi:hypothetical protein
MPNKKAKRGSAITVKILIAVIGLLAVAGAVLFASWDKIFPATPSGPTPTPPAARGPAKPLAGKLTITEAFLVAEPNQYQGDCPITVRFSGRISAAGGAGTVSYRFLRSDGASAPIQVLHFSEPGSQEVRTEWQIGGPGTTYSGWQSIKISDPQDTESPQASFSIQCNAPLPPSVASVKISSATCTLVGEGAYRVDLSGEAMAPEGAAFRAGATPFRPNGLNKVTLDCPGWSNDLDGQCERRPDQIGHVNWTERLEFYGQADSSPNAAAANLFRSGSGGQRTPLAGDVVRNLVCR